MYKMATNPEKICTNVSKKVLIIGAGVAGIIVAKKLSEQPEKFITIGFLDDDLSKEKLHIIDIPVIGNIRNLETDIKKYNIDLVVLAIPSLEAEKKLAIIEQCKMVAVNIRVVTGVEDITFERITQTNVTMEDLLGRAPIKLSEKQLTSQIKGTTIMVTGAGGSIGSEICRQICIHQPKQLVILGHGENSIYQIHMELLKRFGQSVVISPIIADIQDETRIDEVMKKYRPTNVYHAAAHKHVPLMELNPVEAVKNNVIGTKNMVIAAAKYNVENFILVSSDKAVNPQNIMGATKRIAEMTVQMIAAETDKNFSVVRFGNVLGSRGSVIPLFKEQIKQGGPVTVTHPDMTRYFMTIPEAAGLVIQAGSLENGSKIYVLDMGEPIKITTLAENLITMSGYTLQEINIEFTGIRQGDKLHEELMDDDEMYPEQIIPKIHIGKPKLFSDDEVIRFMQEFPTISEKQLIQNIYELVGTKKDVECATVKGAVSK